MRLVLIEWQDSHQGTGWEKIAGAQFQDRALTVRSVGWLAHDGELCKIIIPHLSEEADEVDQQGSGIMTIPTRAVVRVSELAEQPHD